MLFLSLFPPRDTTPILHEYVFLHVAEFHSLIERISNISLLSEICTSFVCVSWNKKDHEKRQIFEQFDPWQPECRPKRSLHFNRWTLRRLVLHEIPRIYRLGTVIFSIIIRWLIRTWAKLLSLGMHDSFQRPRLNKRPLILDPSKFLVTPNGL